MCMADNGPSGLMINCLQNGQNMNESFTQRKVSVEWINLRRNWLVNIVCPCLAFTRIIKTCVEMRAVRIMNVILFCGVITERLAGLLVGGHRVGLEKEKKHCADNKTVGPVLQTENFS